MSTNWQKPFEFPPCDVCLKNQSVGVAASPLGPVSLAYCKNCLSEGADPLWLVHATFDGIGGPQNFNKEWAEGVTAYKDGRYIKWDEIVACYKPTKMEPT